MATRINKYLGEHGYCSRREADRLLRAGSVFVNGKRANLGDQVEETDRVEVLGRRPRATAPEKIYLLLNKPPGYITTTDRNSDNTVMDLVPRANRVFPVGRLDVASCGLLLMTNDGDLALKLTHPRYEHDKEYEVTVDKPIGDAHLRVLAEGVMLDEKKTLPAKVKRLGSREFSIPLREGRNRQIRRMCDELGYAVTRLQRVRVMSLLLGNLQEGKHRALTTQEIAALKKETSAPPRPAPEVGGTA